VLSLTALLGPLRAGVNTAIYSPSGANSGVGFAIPVDALRSSVEQIIRFGKVVRPILGISFAPDQSVEQVSCCQQNIAQHLPTDFIVKVIQHMAESAKTLLVDVTGSENVSSLNQAVPSAEKRWELRQRAFVYLRSWECQASWSSTRGRAAPRGSPASRAPAATSSAASSSAT